MRDQEMCADQDAEERFVGFGALCLIRSRSHFKLRAQHLIAFRHGFGPARKSARRHAEPREMRGFVSWEWDGHIPEAVADR